MRSNATVGQKFNRKSIARSATHRVIEQLEGRRLLAANPYDFHNTPSFYPTSSDLGDIKNGPLAKGGEALIDLFRSYTSFIAKGGNRYDFSSRAGVAKLYNVRGSDLLVTVRTRGSVDGLVGDIKELGGTVLYRSKGKRVVDAYVPLNQVDNLAQRPEILHIRPQLKPILRSSGAVGNDAERSEKTQFVVPAFNVTGAGQTVGAVSDSFDSGGGAVVSYLNGDLDENNRVDVLQEGFGHDEGRAMLELVHDLAPSANLAFNASGGTVNTFADGIRSLREDAGATVIVDDVGFPNEPFFSDGVIDRAVNDVVADGASYFSAAGNSGFAGYATTAKFVAGSNGEREVDFDPSNKVDTRLNVTFNRAGPLMFQWDDAYDGVVANVSADVDFYVYRDGTLITAGTDDNFATGVPSETINVPQGGNYQVVIRLHSLAKGATAPGNFQFASFNDDGMFDSRTQVEYPGYHTSSFGHPGAAGAISVGAVDNAASNAFGSARGVVSQNFSSSGPILRVFDSNGNRLPEPLVEKSPLLSGIQGTNTSVPGFAPFFGTSAAAPNVAAVAALLRELAPTAGPEEIRDALVASAKLNPLNGQKPGEYDQQAGYGLVDALQAASIFSPNTPVSTINVASINNGGSVGSINITFNVPVTGVDLTDFTLTRDGGSRNRFSGSESLTASPDGMSYTINNLRTATSTLGVYTLTLRESRTGIVDTTVAAHPAAGNVQSFDVSLRKVEGLIADQLDDGKIRLRFTDTNSGEDDYRIQRATDAAFSEGVRNIGVGANATSYIDSEVTPGQVYYYRVRAVKGGRFGDVARVSTVASSEGEVFVDNLDVKLKGNWTRYDDLGQAFLGTEARASKTDFADPNTATYTSSDLAKGQYLVYTRYTARDKNATNARYEILQNGKLISTVRVDQTTRGGGWVLVGKFASVGEGGLTVRITSAGANGSVAADALRFLPADNATILAFEKQRKDKEDASN